jgi:hypothetical protein
MMPLQFLASDAVSAELLLVGIPSCTFLIAYSATIWCDAAFYTARVATPVYVLAVLGGLAISLLGGAVASGLAFIAAVNASPDDFSSTPVYAYVLSTFLWPLGWCLLAGAALWIGRGWPGRPARSLLVALIVGFLASALISIGLIVIGVVVPRSGRVLFFLAFLAAAVVLSVAAPLRRRPHRLDRTTG